MKRLPTETMLVTVFLLILSPAAADAQLIAELSTDKETYAYGETIVVTFKLSNPTAEIVQLNAACSPALTFDGVQFPYTCLADHFNYFNPNAWREWTFEIDPAEVGLPSFTGPHAIAISHYGYVQEASVDAPAFVGGTISIEFLSGTPAQDVESIRLALNGVGILSRTRPNGNLLEHWEISGTTTDQAVAQYEGDAAVVEIYSFTPFVPFTSVDAEEGAFLPEQFALGQNYPNPFNPATTIRFDVPRSSHVRLSVFDVQGREIAVLVDEVKAVGSHDVTFDAGALSSGVYLYRLQTDGFSQARVLSLLK